jgi:penicillin amidase/acyl-homoserine-lactone acylase
MRRLRILALGLLVLVVGVYCAALALQPSLPDGLADGARRYDARILRDSWGVPHVFGPTDPDVAFGLAYAHAEDDFATIQGALLAARGRLASVYGPDAAPNDYMVQLLRVWDTVDAQYETELRPETRALCEGYAAGLNLYAARHPGQALPALYPARGKDVVAGFVHKLPLFFGMDKVLKELTAPVRTVSPPLPTPGSNTFAVAPSRSADGFTRLAVNSHQPWEGPVAWYEAHLKSGQGWDMVGGLFPGAPLVLHGHNRDLGWAHTVNRPDLIDVYALETDPAHPHRYRFDGSWRDLEVRTARIPVKLLGPFSWTFEREVLWSVHGPVIQQPHGTYAVRFAGMGSVGQVEAWYRMNRARTLDDWMAALRLQALPMFNCGYADGRGNVAYVYNALLPRRAEGYDWTRDVPGNTSATLWQGYLPFERLPRVVNPPSGFIANSNGTPYEATTGEGNARPDGLPTSAGIERHQTNRGLRGLELFGADPSITREEFDAYKFDVAYSEGSAAVGRLRQLLQAPRPEDAGLREALNLLGRWDRRADAANPAAALAVLTLRPDDTNSATPVATDVLTSRLKDAADRLRRHFGRLDVPWGEVNRLRRGAVDLPVGGAPDTLRAVYGRDGAEGRLTGVAGDSYILLVEWDREGRVSSRSINPYGSAVRDPSSPHYADQAPLFARMELKPVWMDEAEIRAHLEREYRPGEERRP